MIRLQLFIYKGFEGFNQSRINEKVIIMKSNSFCTLAEKDAEYFAERPNKFEMVSCPKKERNCKNYLKEINNRYLESEIYRENKEYQNSIAALKNAFNYTTELKESPCNKCAEFFQTNIVQSLESIHHEIHKMSVGLFRTKRYNLSYLIAGDVLNELKIAATDFKKLKMKRA